MESTYWFLLIGALMLARGLVATSRAPFTSAIVYLCAGLLLGPSLLDVFHFDPLAQAALLEVLTEIAVLISLFSAGVKMPVPVTLKRWAPSLRLAWLSMALLVALVAAFGVIVLGLAPGAAILLAAILAPTDPVLATDVQVRHAGDKDELRFDLTCEAGMNDGSAFPFVMLGLGLLGLHELGPLGWRWFALDVLWATSAAILLGVAGGAGLARLSWKLRAGQPRREVLDDLVGLGLIALVYGAAVWLRSWGFLAVFFAGVALRHTELVLAGAPRDRHGLLDGDMSKSRVARAAPRGEAPSTVSTQALVFKEHLERLSELTLVLLLGGMLTPRAWTWQAWGTALFLFFVARPLSVAAGLAGSDAPLRVRAIAAWFGVRGIGSLYYLMFAIRHGLPAPLARELAQITMVVIVLSILLHGVSVKPLLERFWRRRAPR